MHLAPCVPPRLWRWGTAGAAPERPGTSKPSQYVVDPSPERTLLWASRYDSSGESSGPAELENAVTPSDLYGNELAPAVTLSP